jgi:hypothetical protein
MAAAIVVDPCINRRSNGASLVTCRAETRATVAVGKPAPEGMMLLGATQSIALQKMKVNFF